MVALSVSSIAIVLSAVIAATIKKNGVYIPENYLVRQIWSSMTKKSRKLKYA